MVEWNELGEVGSLNANFDFPLISKSFCLGIHVDFDFSFLWRTFDNYFMMNFKVHFCFDFIFLFEDLCGLLNITFFFVVTCRLDGTR